VTAQPPVHAGVIEPLADPAYEYRDSIAAISGWLRSQNIHATMVWRRLPVAYFDPNALKPVNANWRLLIWQFDNAGDFEKCCDVFAEMH
jgi:hypothetical protein